MIRVVNESDNYTDFSMLEEGDVFYWTKYDGYFMKLKGFVNCNTAYNKTTTGVVTSFNANAVNLSDGHLYLVNEDAEIIKAHSAKLTVDM